MYMFFVCLLETVPGGIFVGVFFSLTVRNRGVWWDVALYL